jgi:hypothetical protein
MNQAWSEFRCATDPLNVWLDAHTVEDPDGMIVKEELLAAYNTACVVAGRPTMTKTAFGLALKRARKGIGEAQRTVNLKTRWVYTGIRLRVDGEN